ncbi:choice-of-anchor J domain-containing protein [Marinicella sp. W31]|uniref:choice-of-anchor J domain-containing protein n=1 Tax=Marinicella sp. W31 TaxID=3023713 RepID=UPI00375740CC
MIRIFSIILLFTCSTVLFAQNPEDFADVTVLPGWSNSNQSAPVGTTGWIQGSTAVFNSHEGADTAFLAANFNNTSGGADQASGVICNWQIMPDNDMGKLKFYSRSTIAQNGTDVFADRLRIRYSPTGNINVGDCTNDFGDFTEELIVINPNLSGEDYPIGYPLNDWQEFQTAVPGDGRIAFVYHVTSAGPLGANSNYVGIDTVSWVDASDLIFFDSFD